ncbi:uncharacterized protein LOC110024878 isoform X2 [Phalaenopsis equestris]|uniref:uncharacterized protein LOC110024878 isoform X2 n=1 Tax=Phalaenopsis equestris TaxID=78828 RepID=UPI0009E52251|nr:uncharacterized protein LOC110024878 isoform X2 [Phalaenopsis equestris]
MAAMKMDSLELEAMRKEDGSWHPCRIFQSSGDPSVGIIVDFGNDEEDVISNKEEALSRLRFRSTPLEGDECTNINGGERVLALQKTKSKSLFIDASIEEPKRVKHSRRVHCRCTFEIKWLNSELKGETVTVPSMSILKLSDRSIDEHPVISGFLNLLNSEKVGETASVISFSEESSGEAEFIGILEKQVEEISKLVDGSKASFADLFLEVKSGTVNVVKQKSKTKPGASQRTTRSRSKNLSETQVEKEAEEKKEKEVEKETKVKPVLTPLAARAALASLVHELPVKPLGFSGEQDFLKRKDSQQSDTTGTTEHSTIEATSNSVKSNFHVQNKVLLCPNPSKRTTNNTNIQVKKSPDRWRTEGKLKPHGSQEMPSRGSSGGIEDEPIVLQNSRSSVNAENSTSSRRLTRSMQKESEVSSLHLKPKRSAHSAVSKEVSVSNDVDKAPISKSPSLDPQDILASSDGVEGGALTKKLSSATNGVGCTKSTKQKKKSNSNNNISPGNNAPTADTGNKAKELVTPDNIEIKKKRLIFDRVDSTSETDSIAERNEPTTKRMTRSSFKARVLA